MHEIMSIFKIGAHISCEITGLTLGTPVKRQETKLPAKCFAKTCIYHRAMSKLVCKKMKYRVQSSTELVL